MYCRLIGFKYLSCVITFTEENSGNTPIILILQIPQDIHFQMFLITWWINVMYRLHVLAEQV